jgi:hypothetical protein
MIKIPFPMDVSGQLEKDICKWVREYAILGNPADHILIEDEELALYFRLRFGL